MCIYVFLGSDIEVPTSRWSRNEACFHVEEMEDEERAVKTHFSKAHVYYLASHEGCGCGFEWDARAEPEEWTREWETMPEEMRREIKWTPSDERRDYETRKQVAEDLAALLKHLLQVQVTKEGGSR